MKSAGNLMDTAQVCKTLGITPSKVRRLIKEGYLEIDRRTTFKHGVMELFRPEQVEALTTEMPKILSRWVTEENNLLGARQAAHYRAAGRKKAIQIKNNKEEFLNCLELMPEKFSTLLRAAFYLFHLNHYAKDGHPYLYDLKERVLRAFVTNYNQEDGLEITLVDGPQKIYLCSHCRSRAKSQHKSYEEYVGQNGGCPRCRRDNSYYDVYEFVVSREAHKFIFHTPYAVARKWFPPCTNISRRYKGHRYEQGYTFGRAIFEMEARAIPMDEVVGELTEFLERSDVNNFDS